MNNAAEKGDYDFDAASLDYAAGGYSMNGLATKHGIPEASLRRYAKKHGWIKGASETKRDMVREALAGDGLDELVTNGLTNDEVRQHRVDEAAQDVQDMTDGLNVARRCIKRLLSMVDQVDSPNDIKRVVEANKAAIETIRKIRSLDNDDTPPETSVSVTIDDGFSELRAAFKKRLETLEPDDKSAGRAEAA